MNYEKWSYSFLFCQLTLICDKLCVIYYKQVKHFYHFRCQLNQACCYILDVPMEEEDDDPEADPEYNILAEPEVETEDDHVLHARVTSAWDHVTVTCHHLLPLAITCHFLPLLSITCHQFHQLPLPATTNLSPLTCHHLSSLTVLPPATTRYHLSPPTRHHLSSLAITYDSPPVTFWSCPLNI